MANRRLKRVSTLLMGEISDLIRREVKDPRVGFATVTDVTVAPDLSTARVYVSVLGDTETRDRTVASLNNAASFLHRRIRERVVMKKIPALHFFPDDSIERGVRVCALLDRLKEEETE
ncbi:MAG: 30S ribosome-binding factor RbfA [bacterium]